MAGGRGYKPVMNNPPTRVMSIGDVGEVDLVAHNSMVCKSPGWVKSTLSMAGVDGLDVHTIVIWGRFPTGTVCTVEEDGQRVRGSVGLGGWRWVAVRLARLTVVMRDDNPYDKDNIIHVLRWHRSVIEKQYMKTFDENGMAVFIPKEWERQKVVEYSTQETMGRFHMEADDGGA